VELVEKRSEVVETLGLNIPRLALPKQVM
jgi:hypothetical protein